MGLFMKTFVFLCLAMNAFAFNPSSSFADIQEPKLLITNRVLVTVMNKPISVLDVVKKMNVTLEQNYPQYKDDPSAKYHFYMQNWKYVLMQMVDAELMLKDAEKLELKITDADIREQMHERFGPNIMKSLTSIGITYDEAKKMIETDLITQRMMWYRVHSKALSKVGPDEIKKSYQDYVCKNPSSNTWTYEVLSMKSDDKESSSKIAGKAFDMLSAAKLGIQEAALALKNDSHKDHKTHITVSDTIQAKEYELSQNHKDVLKTLSKGQFSTPVEQVSKNGKEKVYRIFHLLDFQKQEPEAFNQIADQFKDELIQKQVNDINSAYLKKIRARYGYSDLSYIEKIEPFILQK